VIRNSNGGEDRGAVAIEDQGCKGSQAVEFNQRLGRNAGWGKGVGDFLSQRGAFKREEQR